MNNKRKSIVDQVKEYGMTFDDFLVKARYLAEIEKIRQEMEFHLWLQVGFLCYNEMAV